MAAKGKKCNFLLLSLAAKEWKVLKKHPPPSTPQNTPPSLHPLSSPSLFLEKKEKKNLKETNGGWVSGWVGLEPGLNQLPTLGARVCP
jgi:hypothetical protein